MLIQCQLPSLMYLEKEADKEKRYQLQIYPYINDSSISTDIHHFLEFLTGPYVITLEEYTSGKVDGLMRKICPGPKIKMAQSNKLLPVVSVSIVFDRQDATYRAGETLAGWIDLHLKSDIRVKAMKLHVQGQARVSWNEKRTYTKGVSPTVSHKHSEVILDHQVYLIKKDGHRCTSTSQSEPRKTHRKSLCFPLVAGSEEPEGVVISAGPHRFSFEYILPRNLPSSFEGKWGQVSYGVRFTMDRPWKHTLERDRSFTVHSVVDFNDEPEIMRPIYGSGEFNVMTCCFAGEVYVQTQVSRKGFLRGDSAPVHVEIYNNSDRVMRDTRISLVQHAIFRASTRIKKTSTSLCCVRQGEVGPDQCRVWDVQLDIPPDVVPSTLRSDDWRGISVRYTISVSLSPSWWTSNFVLPVQIIIGTIGLRRETAHRYLSQLMAAATSSTASLPITPRRRPDSQDSDHQRRDWADSARPPSGADSYPPKGHGRSVSLVSASTVAVMNRGNSATTTKKLRGRQSVPCFPTSVSGATLTAPPRPLKERRASAIELGAICKGSHGRNLDLDTLVSGRKLSSSLDAVSGSRIKMTVKEARSRLKSVSEEKHERCRSSSKDSGQPQQKEG